MYHIYSIWLILLFVLLTKADHFRGGTISWKPISNNIISGQPISIMIIQTYSWTSSLVGCNDSMIAAQSPSISTGAKVGSGLSLYCNASCSTAGGYVGQEVPITGPCIDFSPALDLTVDQRSDIVNLTANASFTVTFGTSGGWQMLALGSSAGWSVSSRIDLHARPDNGLINTSPVATCISYISVPVGIPQTIQISVLDADNDVIRCRFANGSSECVNTCPPASLPVGTTLSSSCLLTITGITSGDYYLVAIQVEDYISSTSTTPLSSVPLQFLIRVYATQNCTLKPLLIADVNSNTCQGVQAGINFTMTFTVINRCPNERIINDIATISFPILFKSALVQNTTNTSLWTMEMTWMPSASQVGSQVFCAVASDNETVQSDQYCISFFVGLNSVPLCPGVTVAPTTMVTTMQTSMTSAVGTSQQTSQQTTTTTTTTKTTTTTTVSVTSSTRSSTTVKSGNKVDWPLILGLSLLALALALCCLFYCLYYFLCSKDRKRRRKSKVDDLRHNFEWNSENGNSHSRLVQEHDYILNQELTRIKSIEKTNNVRIPSSVSTGRLTQNDNLIDQHRPIKSAYSLRKTNFFINNQKKNQNDTDFESTNVDNTTHDTSMRTSPDLSTVSCSSKAQPIMNSVKVIKLPRSNTPSTVSNRRIVTIKHQSKEYENINSNNSSKTKIKERPASSVSVSRIKRSASSHSNNHTNQHITTASLNSDVTRITTVD